MKLRLKRLLQTMHHENVELDNFLSLVFIVVAVAVFGPTLGQGASICPPSLNCRTCDPTFTYCTSCNAYYNLHNGTCTPCGTHCIQCTYGVSCDLCDSGYGPDPANASNCASCTPSHCSGCAMNINTCTTCAQGYGQISGSQNCGPCSSNCAGGCNIQGAGKCDQCDARYGYTAINSCAPCSPNCYAGCAKAGAGKCDPCDSGFGFTATNSCAPCSAGCNNTVGCYNSGAGLCDQCASGYGFASSTNKACGFCSPNCAAGCSNSSAGKCDRCDSGFGFTATNSCAPMDAQSSTNSVAGPVTSTSPAVVGNGEQAFPLSYLALGLVIGVPCGVIIIILLAVVIALFITRSNFRKRLKQLSNLRKRLKQLEDEAAKQRSGPQTSVQNTNNREQGNQTRPSYEQLTDTSSERHYAYMNSKVSETDSEFYNTIVSHNPNRNTLIA